MAAGWVKRGLLVAGGTIALVLAVDIAGLAYTLYHRIAGKQPPVTEQAQKVVTEATKEVAAVRDIGQAVVSQDRQPKVIDFQDKVLQAITALNNRINALERKKQEANARNDPKLAGQYAQEQQLLYEMLQQYLAELKPGEQPKPPPTPPELPVGVPPSTGGDSEGGDDGKKLWAAALAAMCLAQPELCAFLGVIPIDLGLFDGDTILRNQFLDVVQKVARGGEPNADELKRLMDAFNSGRLKAEPLDQLIKLIQQLPPDRRQRAQAVLGKLSDQLVGTGGLVAKVDKLLKDKPTATVQEVKGLIDYKVAGKVMYRNELEKRLLQTYFDLHPDLKAKYWADGGLASVEVVPPGQ
jgi:hypothetical protein